MATTPRDYAPIRPAIARHWRAWTRGPYEARILYPSLAAGTALSLANRMPRRGRGKLIRAVAQLTMGVEAEVSTPWGGRFGSRSDETFFLRGICSEPFETALLLRLIKAEDTVVDVGANRGWYTVLGGLCAGSGGRVVAFEPDPRARLQTEANVALNGLDNVVVSARAVSDRLGSSTFVEAEDMAVSRLHETGGIIRRKQGDRSTEVELTTLDVELGRLEIDEIDLLKTDVEGAEEQVLQGFERFLHRATRAPIMMTELLPRSLSKGAAHVFERINAASGNAYRHYAISYSDGMLVSLDDAVRRGSRFRNVLSVPEHRRKRVERAVSMSD